MKNKNSIIATICIFLASIALCSCGGQSTTNAQNTSSESETMFESESSGINETYESQPIALDPTPSPEPENQYVILSPDEFRDCFQVIELTTENLEDYFEIVESEYENKNAFGELESYGVFDMFQLKDPVHTFADNIFKWSREVDYIDYIVLRCERKGTVKTYKNGKYDRSDKYSGPVDIIIASGTGNFNFKHSYEVGMDGTIYEYVRELNEYKITKVAGRITQFTEPSSDKWNIASSGERYLLVQSKDETQMFILFENGQTMYYGYYKSVLDYLSDLSDSSTPTDLPSSWNLRNLLLNVHRDFWD